MDRGSATLRIAIGHALLASVLVLAVCLPVAAQAEPDDGEPLTMAQASAAALAQALDAAPSMVWQDAPVPASVAEYVPVVRERLRDDALDHFLWPLYLRFVEARCSDVGAVALIFEEIRPMIPLRTYAYAVSGSMPASVDDAWEPGGTGHASVLDDPGFIRSMGSATVACP